MSGFEPILIGSALGAMTNSKNPLQGALLGGVLGGVGGAAMGVGNPAATATMKGAVMPAAGSATTIAPVTAAATPASALQGASSSIFANPSAATYASTGGSTGFIPSMTADVTMADRLKAVTQFAKENPFAMSSGLNAAQQLYGEKPMEFPQAPGLLRGNPIPEQPPSYAAMSPMQPITLI